MVSPMVRRMRSRTASSTRARLNASCGFLNTHHFVAQRGRDGSVEEGQGSEESTGGVFGGEEGSSSEARLLLLGHSAAWRN